MSGFTIFLIVTVLCPIACAFVARAKNKNPVSWFCWGIIFSVFALAVLLVSPEE